MKYLTLDTLADHPKNVRARTEYGPQSIHTLAASIEALGLLQSLVVQQLPDGRYGVLAGRRRMQAMQHLADTGRLEDGFKVPCKVIAKDVDHVTALSLAENTMQQPMAPLDEYEAFAAMIAEGSDVERIAEVFGTDNRAVKERLRYGMIHADIREAMRAGSITLDVMKAYASHPCTETQKRVFDGFVGDPGQQHSTWRVRETLAAQDIRADDPLAIMVMDRYVARDGEIVRGLFEDDTVLKDRALAEGLRDEMLREAGETRRDAHGFAWVETRTRFDYAELSAYGRIYPQPIEQDAEGEARLSAIAERLDEIAAQLDAEQESGEDGPTCEELSDEYEALEEEADRLQSGYLPEQAAHAGLVVAPDNAGGFRFEMGLVRVEDFAALNPPRPEATDAGDGTDAPAPRDHDAAPAVSAAVAAMKAPSAHAASVTGAGIGKKAVDPLSPEALSAALRDDLAVERALIVQASLYENPALARDVLTFRLASTLLGSMTGYTPCIDLTARKAHRSHSRPEVQDGGIRADIENVHAALDLSFLDAGLTDGEKLRAFRALDEGAKADILAVCVGTMVEPSLAAHRPSRETTAEALAAEAVEDIAALWRPTAANYWSRVSRDHMLAVLIGFGLDAEAEEHRSAKKATLASYMETLFAQPFATLSEEQRAAVLSWTPPGMGTQGETLLDGMEEDDPAVQDETDPDARQEAA